MKVYETCGMSHAEGTAAKQQAEPPRNGTRGFESRVIIYNRELNPELQILNPESRAFQMEVRLFAE